MDEVEVESGSFVPPALIAAAKVEDGTEDCQITKLAKTMDAASLFLTPEQQDCVTLKAGGKSFSFKKSILIKDSEYFATCFKNENFIEGKTLTVEFDDIDPDLLGIYLHLASMHAIKKFVKFDPGLMKEPKRLKPMVDLYEIADRFMNLKMAGLVGCSILELAADHPINTFPHEMTDQERSWAMNNYKEAIEALKYEDDAREYMREKLVAAYRRWVPLRNFRHDLIALEDAPEFVRELTICFSKILADQKSEWPPPFDRPYPSRTWPSPWEVDNGVLDMGDWTQWRPFPPIEPSPLGWGSHSTECIGNISATASTHSGDAGGWNPDLPWGSNS